VEGGIVRELQGYGRVRQEVKYGREGSRIDLLLEAGPDGRACYVEIKNVTARDPAGLAIFPDAVSERGRKHLRELAAMVEEGHRAVIFFCVQREDVEALRPADEIDPAYGRTLREVTAAGVEALACVAEVSSGAVRLVRPVPVVL
jgi:sugar fermentation stimulation protein A